MSMGRNLPKRKIKAIRNWVHRLTHSKNKGKKKKKSHGRAKKGTER